MPFPAGGPAPGPIKTSAIKSRILNIATPNNYLVKIQPPGKVTSLLSQRGIPYGVDGRDVELRCHRTTLPGSAFLTHSVSSDYQGNVEEIPYRRGYDTEITMSFIVDTDYKVINFFETWMDYMSGMANSEGDNTIEYYEPGAVYRPNYYNDYISDSVFITKFEKDTGTSHKGNRIQKPEIEVKLIKAYPKQVQQIELSYGPTGEFLNLDVSFGYSRYVKRNVNIVTSGPILGDPSIGLNDLVPGAGQPPTTILNPNPGSVA